MFNDEERFHINSFVNGQNFLFWFVDNLHTFHEIGLRSLKVGVNCAMSRSRTIRAIFCENTLNLVAEWNGIYEGIA